MLLKINKKYDKTVKGNGYFLHLAVLFFLCALIYLFFSCLLLSESKEDAIITIFLSIKSGVTANIIVLIYHVICVYIYDPFDVLFMIL